MSDDDILPEHERVRAALADVPPAPAAARSAAIARALDEFDRMHTAPNVVAFPQRARWYRGVAAAAAVLLVGIIGLGALKGTDSNDSSSAGGAASISNPVAYQANSQSSADAANVGGLAPASTRMVASVSTIAAITGPAEAPIQVASPEQLTTLNPPDQVAAEVSVAASPATARISFSFTCALGADQTVLREIIYQGTPAVAVRDSVTGVIEALDANCTVLARSQP